MKCRARKTKFRSSFTIFKYCQTVNFLEQNFPNKYMSITTKNCFQNNIIKTTTEQNTQNKMESIKEMSCLQSKEKTIHLKPK